MNKLSQNVHRMTNAELIGLAKNRFLEEETQIQIVKHPYRRAKTYLASNPGISSKTRQLMWDIPGYVLKCEMLSSGLFQEAATEKYKELYYTYGDAIRNRSFWRLHSTFVGGSYWNGSQSHLFVPSEILGDIYEKSVRSVSISNYNNRYLTRSLIKHCNTPTEVIVKISASHPEEQIRIEALKILGTASSSRK